MTRLVTTSLPKSPYDGFFECVSFQCEGSLDSFAANAQFSIEDATLVHPLDAVSSNLLDACLAGTRLETLALSPSAVNGTFYDAGGKELGRTSFNK